MARVLLDNNRSPSEYEADISFDMWSLGCLLFELTTGHKLFDPDHGGSLKHFDLKKLAEWGDDDFETEWRRATVHLPNDSQVAQDLLKKLLSPCAEDRRRSFNPQNYQGVLKEPFFAGKGLDDVRDGQIITKEILRNQELLRKDVQGISLKLDRVLDAQRAITSMLATVLKDEFRYPTLLLVVPQQTPASMFDGVVYRFKQLKNLVGKPMML